MQCVYAARMTKKSLEIKVGAKGTRVTLPIGAPALDLVNKVAARYRKETGVAWTTADVLATCCGLGLREQANKFGLPFQPLLTLDDK